MKLPNDAFLRKYPSHYTVQHCTAEMMLWSFLGSSLRILTVSTSYWNSGFWNPVAVLRRSPSSPVERPTWRTGTCVEDPRYPANSCVSSRANAACQVNHLGNGFCPSEATSADAVVNKNGIPIKPCPNCRLISKINDYCCFKLLSFRWFVMQ